MLVMRSCFAVVAMVLVAASLAACSSDADAGNGSTSCAGHTRPATTKGGRDVSFAREVLPIFQASCSFVSCHGTPNMNGVYLGARDRGSNASAIREDLLRTTQRSTMPLVTPGDSNRSYLVRKLDGDFCGVACTGGDCGDRMPKNGDALAPAALATIEAWIANGAPDN